MEHGKWPAGVGQALNAAFQQRVTAGQMVEPKLHSMDMLHIRSACILYSDALEIFAQANPLAWRWYMHATPLTMTAMNGELGWSYGPATSKFRIEMHHVVGAPSKDKPWDAFVDFVMYAPDGTGPWFASDIATNYHSKNFSDPHRIGPVEVLHKLIDLAEHPRMASAFSTAHQKALRDFAQWVKGLPKAGGHSGVVRDGGLVWNTQLGPEDMPVGVAEPTVELLALSKTLHPGTEQ